MLEKLSRAIMEKEALILDNEIVKTSMRVLKSNPKDHNAHVVIQ